MSKTLTADGEADTRTRIRAAAAELFATRGYAGTGLKAIAERAPAPFGSIYHFFPGGKDDLARDMITTTGPQFRDRVLGVLAERDDPVEALEWCFARAADELVASDYRNACPIATLALDVASVNDPLRRAAAEVFADWEQAATAWFGAQLGDVDEARRLGRMMIVLIEGAFLMCRTARTPEAMVTAGETMVALFRAAASGDRSGRGRSAVV